MCVFVRGEMEFYGVGLRKKMLVGEVLCGVFWVPARSEPSAVFILTAAPAHTTTVLMM